MSDTFFIQGITSDKLEELIEKAVAKGLAGLKPTASNELKYYSRDEACKLLKICESTLDQYVRAGVIKGSRFGRRILFSEADIETAIREIPTARYKRR